MRKISAHLAGGLAIVRPSRPNRTKPILAVLQHILILSQLIGRVQSFGKLFSSRLLAQILYISSAFWHDGCYTSWFMPAKVFAGDHTSIVRHSINDGY